MANEDEKLRGVSLEDLPSETLGDKRGARPEGEEVVEGRVSVEDLDRLKINSPALRPLSSPKSGSVVYAKGHPEDQSVDFPNNKSKKQILNHITNKHSFDRKRSRYWVLLLTAAVFAAGYFLAPWNFGEGTFGEGTFNEGAFDEGAVKLGAVGKYLIQGVFGALSILHLAFSKVYPLICLALLVAFPIKVYTDTMIQIFYEGLSLPSEIFPIGKPLRQRILWKDIKSVNLKSRRGVPFAQLFDQRKRLIGEMRLDVDDLKGMYSILDLYAPEEHPLRELLTRKPVNN